VLSVVQTASRGNGVGSIVDRVIALITGLVAEASGRGLRLDGIGIGLPGLVDVEKGMMIDAVNLMSDFAHVPSPRCSGVPRAFPCTSTTT
jgi:predicted NBD/HSP70 family sugar kinase